MKTFHRENIEQTGKLTDFFEDFVWVTDLNKPAGYFFLSTQRIADDAEWTRSIRNISGVRGKTQYLYAKPKAELLETAEAHASEGRVGCFKMIGAGWSKEYGEGQCLLLSSSANFIGSAWYGVVDFDINTSDIDLLSDREV